MGCFAYERTRSNLKSARGVAVISVLAGVSAAAFLAVVAWQIYQSSQGVDAGAATPAIDPYVPASQPIGTSVIPSPYALVSTATDEATSSNVLSLLGEAVVGRLVDAYLGLQTAGVFSTSTAQAAAQDTLPLLEMSVSYTAYAPSDLTSDRDTSYARMLAYRNDLRGSLAPLLKSTTPEYEILLNYLRTSDATYLVQLADVAQNYRDAIEATAKVVVPADAIPYHVGILNAMREFAAVLDALAAPANDPFASAAYLRSYDQAESSMLASFNALTTYYKSKQP